MLRPQLRLWSTFIFSVLFVSFATLLTGCSHFHQDSSPEYVYVTVRKMYLRDRVAVVANRVAEVTNGERLKVLTHDRRFLKVKTPKGAVGWIEDHAVIDQGQFNEFQGLAKQHAMQTPIATATLYNDLYMHLKPGRETRHFYLLQANAKVFLLQRASIPKFPAGSVLARVHADQQASVAAQAQKGHKVSFESKFLPSVSMDDWWLVRDSTGQTGWMLSQDLDVNVPEVVAQYAENERMVGAYVLRTVNDPDSGQPNGQVPEYLTVLRPYKQGLPYDFDQVRVFTWDTRRHRYGTSFRKRDFAGFFPVKVLPGDSNSPNGPEPTFTIRVADGEGLSLDPETGVARATHMETLTFRLEGNLVHQVLPAGAKPEPRATRRPVRSRVTHRSRRHKHTRK